MNRHVLYAVYSVWRNLTMVQSPDPFQPEEPVSVLIFKGIMLIGVAFIAAWFVALFRLLAPW